MKEKQQNMFALSYRNYFNRGIFICVSLGRDRVKSEKNENYEVLRQPKTHAAMTMMIRKENNTAKI